MTAKKPKKRKPDDASESKRFERAARELGADESGKAFQRAFAVVVPKKKTSKASSPSG